MVLQDTDVRLVTEKALAEPGFPANTIVQAIVDAAVGGGGGGGGGGGIVLIEAAATVPPVGTPAGTVVARKAGSSGATPIDSFLFDGFTEGATPTGSGAWTVSGTSGTFQALAAAANHGARGGRLASLTAFRQVAYNTAATTATRVAAQSARFIAWPTAPAYIMTFASGGSNQLTAGVEADGKVRIRNGSTVVATSAGSLSLNTWYRFEWKVIHTPTPTQELRVFPAGTTSAIYTLTGSSSNAADHEALCFAVPASPNSISLDIDDLRIGSDWLGPFGGSSAAGSGLGWWDGTTILDLADIT